MHVSEMSPTWAVYSKGGKRLSHRYMYLVWQECTGQARDISGNGLMPDCVVRH